MNIYSKAYKKNQEEINEFASPEDAMIKSLQSAARMMEKVAKACEENNYEERATWSEKVILIMDYLQGGLERETPAQQKAAAVFENLMASFAGAVAAINTTNDPEVARRMAVNLNEFAKMWENRS